MQLEKVNHMVTKRRTKIKPLENLPNPALARAGGHFGFEKVRKQHRTCQMISVFLKRRKHP